MPCACVACIYKPTPSNITGCVHLVIITKTSDFQETYGVTAYIFLAQGFLYGILKKGNTVAIVDLSSSRFQTRVVVYYSIFWIIIFFLAKMYRPWKKIPQIFFWKESCVSTGSIHGLHMRWLTSLSKQVASSQHDIFFHRNNSDGDPQGFICTCSFENKAWKENIQNGKFGISSNLMLMGRIDGYSKNSINSLWSLCLSICVHKMNKACKISME